MGETDQSPLDLTNISTNQVQENWGSWTKFFVRQSLGGGNGGNKIIRVWNLLLLQKMKDLEWDLESQVEYNFQLRISARCHVTL